MEREAVEAYLHEHIPLSGAMGVSVVRCDSTGVTLTARGHYLIWPEIVCGTPPAPVRTIKVDVATGKIMP